MKQQIMSQFPWPVLPSIALVIFFVFFVGLFLITHVRAKTALYRHASALPLDDATRSLEHVQQ